MFFLLSAPGTVYQACGFGGVDANNWVQINAIVLLIALSLGGVFWALSNIMSPRQGEKMKGLVKAEVFQGVIGIMIVGILLSVAVAWCNIGASLTSSALSGIGITNVQNPMQFSETYLQNLAFVKGLSLFDTVYSETALLMINGIVLQHVAALLEKIQEGFLPIQISFSSSVANLSALYGGAFSITSFVVFGIVFGIIFIIYLLLPLVSATALTVIVPVAIAMRMIPFVGPKVREISDLFLSIAIAAYFIFPLMIIMNNLLLTYMYTACSPIVTVCNPYSSYLGAYSLNNIPVGTLFTTSPTSLGSVYSLPKDFFGNIITSSGGVLATVVQILKNMALLPEVFIGIGQEIAVFTFQGVFLIGLDILVTVAFAKALTEALNSISGVVSGGAFWD